MGIGIGNGKKNVAIRNEEIPNYLNIQVIQKNYKPWPMPSVVREMKPDLIMQV